MEMEVAMETECLVDITPHRISVLLCNISTTLPVSRSGRTYATLYDCMHLPSCMYASLQL